MAKDRRKNAPARSGASRSGASKSAGTRTAKSTSRTAASKTKTTKSTASAPAKKKTGKRKMSPGKIVLIVLLVILIIVALAFIIVVGKTIYESLTAKKNVPEVDITDFDTTPASDRDKVAYYLFGLMGPEGEDGATGPTELLSLLCWDKQANKISILQVPQSTYIGEDPDWTVRSIKDVWSNPKPLNWCDTCRKPVYEPEITDGKHTVCQTALTKKAGSSYENLIGIFNDQYSMPVDQFFLLPQEAFVKLVDLVDGVDVDLEADMKLGTIDYKKGVQTLDGESALAYLLKKGDGVTGDVTRMLNSRKVITALLQRLMAAAEKGVGAKDPLVKDIIGPLMSGSTPIRTLATTEAMAAMMPSPSKVKTEDLSYNTAFASMIQGFSKAGLANVTAYVMPGSSATSNKVGYFSPHKAELAALLGQAFNPYGRAITAADLQLTELVEGKDADVHEQKLSELAVTQSGDVTPGTTTTAAA